MEKLSRRRPRAYREKRSRVINVRLSPSELASITEVAAKAGITMSGFIRSLSVEGAGIEPFLNDEDRVVFSILHEEVRRVGVNLNALLRSVHRGKVRDPAIADSLGELRPVVAALLIELRQLAARSARKHGVIV